MNNNEEIIVIQELPTLRVLLSLNGLIHALLIQEFLFHILLRIE